MRHAIECRARRKSLRRHAREVVAKLPLDGDEELQQALRFALAPMTFSSSMKGRFPEARHDDLVAEMKTSDMGVMRRTLHPYFEHMDRYGSLVSPLCDSGVRTWVVRGDRDEIGLSDEERRGLEACPNVTLLTVPDAAHFIMTDRPDRTAELLLEIVGAPTDEAQFRTR